MSSRTLMLWLHVCIFTAHAAGDHDHGHDDTTSGTVVEWAIPGEHSHGGETMEHDMTVELGRGKVFQVKQNTALTFTWSNSHNLVSVSTASDLEDCVFTNATELAGESTTGTYLLDTADLQTYYLTCGLPGHCGLGQQLIVEVLEEVPAGTSGLSSSSGFGPALSFPLMCAGLASRLTH
mmetsp:Transcript_96175/g.170728  ORF Transcript_96175/g.170728 Transcript_96175/m.170728 type:complete len:179 (+) Transcript_96175:68-604(+)